MARLAPYQTQRQSIRQHQDLHHKEVHPTDHQIHMQVLRQGSQHRQVYLLHSGVLEVALAAVLLEVHQVAPLEAVLPEVDLHLAVLLVAAPPEVVQVRQVVHLEHLEVDVLKMN